MTDDPARIDDPTWCAHRLEAGDTVAAFATACGVSRQTASSWLKRHGLHANHRPHPRPDRAELAVGYEDTKSIRQLASRHGISTAVMRTWLFQAGISPIGKPGRPALNLDLNDLGERRARGETLHSIATELCVSPHTLRRRLGTGLADGPGNGQRPSGEGL
jgi:transposase-like protein